MISVNLFVPDCAEAIEFYQKAFGARIRARRLDAPMGERSVRFQVCDTHFSIMDENPAIGGYAPVHLQGTSMSIQLFVDPVLDWRLNNANGKLSPTMISGVMNTLTLAVKAGAVMCEPSTDSSPIITLSDGSELGNIRDPFGYLWSICSQPQNQQFLTMDTQASHV